MNHRKRKKERKKGNGLWLVSLFLGGVSSEESWGFISPASQRIFQQSLNDFNWIPYTDHHRSTPKNPKESFPMSEGDPETSQKISKNLKESQRIPKNPKESQKSQRILKNPSHSQKEILNHLKKFQRILKNPKESQKILPKVRKRSWNIPKNLKESQRIPKNPKESQRIPKNPQ